MKLNELQGNPGSTHRKMRVGRGIGSGKGKTAGRGYKGQGSRTGVSNMGEGGQTPLFRRLPKRGFKSHSRKVVEAVNLGQLESFVAAKKLGAKIDREALKKIGLVKECGSLLKILATGEVKTKFEIEANLASKAAVEAVEKAGGKINLVEKKSTRVKKEAA